MRSVFSSNNAAGAGFVLKDEGVGMGFYDNQAKLIRDARERLGLSQLEISKHFNLTSAQLISNVERGICPFPTQKARKLCDILKIQYSTTWRAAVLEDSWRRYTRKSRAA